MPYCTVEDVRAEGEFSAGDPRIQKMIGLATAYIDKMTGQWFDERPATLVLDSPGGPILPLPVPPIALTEVLVDGQAVTYTVDYNKANPRLLAKYWPAGPGAVSAAGTWGHLENGTTPAMINHLAVRLVIRELPLASDVDGQEAKKRARITSESVDGHSYSLAQLTAAGSFTGDPELDTILMTYQRPAAWGVV